MSFLFFMLILSPIITFIIHAVVIRLSGEQSLQLKAVFSMLIGNIPIIFIILLVFSKIQMDNTIRLATIIYSLIVYNVLAYVYFHIFNMSETARRIRILVELKKAGVLRKGDIFEQYDPSDIVNVRLDRLLNLKQITIEGGFYKINNRFLLIVAKMYNVWQHLLGLQI